MNTVKRILGIFVMGFGFMFLFIIPKHLHSDDPKAHMKIGTDVVLAFILGGSGFILLEKPKKD